MRDHFQGTGGLASQHQVAQMNPRQDGRRINGARCVGVKLQSAGYGEPRILGLGKMSKFKIAPVQIAQEVFGLQVVGPIADDRAAILEQGEFGQIDVLP